MWDFELGRAIGLMARTAPFIALRLAIYLGITLAYVVATGGGGGIGYMIGSTGDAEAAANGAFWGASTGFALVSGVLYFAREYLLYMVKAGHIAVLVPLLDNQPIPEGRNQITHATAVVRERFVESSVLFGVDQLIKGILKAFNATVLTVSAILPIPALQNVMKFVTAVINMSLTYVDEVILAYNIRTQQENPWAGARDGVVLYAQNYKNLLKNAVWLTVFVWFLTLLVFIIVFAPVAALVALFPGVAGFWTFAIAAVTAYALKAALIDPIAMTCLMQAYFKATEGQAPRQDWADKLNSVSGKFKQLGDKAMAFTKNRFTPAAAATPAANP
ncbi:hypothetical protein [Sinimarinibacterium flocculans]|uniref:Uncharacterized protein n=1 Tax=Sinimarinibacterium flocculans TaxID=985250 RepID=A0A318EF26_9GAMM|nr:hypothetical protein [Sinimarinibacterium flocculans]PXV66619.1 hypothetical protein C8D93_107184 [Sinimarinibacterium flocculans]